jgi:hypothetical protein
MSQGRQYPIQTLLRSLVGAFESDRSEFVQKLGYGDLEAGRLHLDSWLDRGTGYDVFLKRVAAAFYDHASELETALIETAAIKAAEGDPGWLERCGTEDASFHNFIHVQGEKSVPDGICIFGMTGGHERWTTIRIPDTILRLPLAEQLAALPELMRAYLVEYRGACPFFGLVKSFLYVCYQDYYRFDRDCRFIERIDKPFRRGSCFVSLR